MAAQSTGDEARVGEVKVLESDDLVVSRSWGQWEGQSSSGLRTQIGSVSKGDGEFLMFSDMMKQMPPTRSSRQI